MGVRCTPEGKKGSQEVKEKGSGNPTRDRYSVVRSILLAPVLWASPVSRCPGVLPADSHSCPYVWMRVVVRLQGEDSANS